MCVRVSRTASVWNVLKKAKQTNALDTSFTLDTFGDGFTDGSQ